MNGVSVAVRILQQLRHEKRTLILVLVAPIALLSLVYYLFRDTGMPLFSFDALGSAFLGIIVYFLVFLIAGINLLGERTSGMLERLLITPIRRWEIVCGYFLGFGALTLLQSTILSLFYIYALDITLEGSFFLVLHIVVLTSFNALTLGMLLSSLAHSEFQMMQFIPLVILPQIIFCGLFPLSGVWETVGKCMPLHYTASPLQQVVLHGAGFGDIGEDMAVLAGLALLFAVLNVLVLKKHRRI
jgi:ABC-2 type transport system permease protein